MRFEHWVRDQLPPLLRLAQSLSADRQLGEDLVQDVLVKVHARWDRISATEHPDAYVRRMLVNEHLSWRRKWARLVPTADVGLDLEAGDRHAHDHAERDALVREVRRLPERQRVVVTMRYLADLDDRAIAEALGCSETTVRVHASRALATLRIATDETIWSRT